ncbi:ORF6N domain-containing protein [Flavobacterium pectinovorum]|uniref:DNA-binding protein n=1 Tax=Flavobacterium pectinovorum TaxID=29533 RepID=A0AB36NYL2_9FLAO|nr:ORF6N domain-containing protein [Flavobacterium pectinovorum]OXB02720.1 DNA-binding protein [Flavobacterium pectinovorum]SHL96776.1 ORF6N domain-containing protein [Flavobacterium pectinovorum]
MEDRSLLSEETISNKIYFIRNQKVMLDFDLAALYGVETRRLNEQVKRNISRFPSDFMFQLTEIELENLMSQIATSSWGGIRKLPFAFTEHGVLMLSSVLKSDKAIQTNIQIMRIFTKVRQMLLDTTEIKVDILQIQKKLENHDKNIELVFSYLDELTEKKENESERVKIGYKK